MKLNNTKIHNIKHNTLIIDNNKVAIVLSPTSPMNFQRLIAYSLSNKKKGWNWVCKSYCAI